MWFRSLHAFLLTAAVAACGSSSSPECTASTQCDFAPGGQCKMDPAGHSFCQYGDATCPGGVRWSAEAGDGLASACVAAFTVQVTKQGGGGGTVSSTSGINCGPTCSSAVADGTSVTLTAAPDATSLFTAWGGDAATCGTSTVCILTVSQATNAIAMFDKIAAYPLTVSITGSGVGTVKSQEGRIECGTMCTATYQTGTMVQLMASTSASAVFTGWFDDAASCGLAATCTLDMNTARRATARFSQTGASLWISHIGGAGDEFGQLVAVDPAGDVVIAGLYLYTDATAGSFDLVNHGSLDDVFIAKLSRDDGHVVWAKGWGGTGIDTISSLAIDATTGDAIVAGTFQGSADFGGAAALMHAGDGDGYYLGRYSGADGHAIWVSSIDATFMSSVVATVSASGVLYLAGSFNGNLNLDSSHQLTAASFGDGFLARLSSDGKTAAWATQMPGQSAGDLMNVKATVVDSVGNVVMAGNFKGGLSLAGSGTDAYKSGGGTDAFVAKFRPDNGGNLWVRPAGGSLDDSCNGVAVGPSNEVVAICQSDIGNGSVPLDYGNGVQVLPGPADGNKNEVVVAKYSATNGYDWAHRLGGPNDQFGTGIGVDASGDRVLVGGSFLTEIELPNRTLSSASIDEVDAWTAALSSADGTDVWGQKFGSTRGVTIGELAVDDTTSRVYVSGSFINLVDYGGSNQLDSDGGQDGYSVCIVPQL